MNNEELAAVCEGHDGKPWWPDGLAYHDDLNQWLADVEIADTVNESHHFKIKLEPDAAADMILGSAVRWLIANGSHHIILRQHASDLFAATTTLSGERWEDKSLLATVLSACLATEVA